VNHAVLYNEIRKNVLTFEQASLLKTVTYKNKTYRLKNDNDLDCVIKFKNDYGTIESIISFDKQIYFLINIIKKLIQNYLQETHSTTFNHMIFSNYLKILLLKNSWYV
jgi:hypothetical protein